MERAGGNQVKDRFFPIDDERVAGVVAALKPDDDIRIVGEEVDDLPFAFVSPLSADDRDVGHVFILDLEFWSQSKIENLKSKIVIVLPGPRKRFGVGRAVLPAPFWIPRRRRG